MCNRSLSNQIVFLMAFLSRVWKSHISVSEWNVWKKERNTAGPYSNDGNLYAKHTDRCNMAASVPFLSSVVVLNALYSFIPRQFAWPFNNGMQVLHSFMSVFRKVSNRRKWCTCLCQENCFTDSIHEWNQFLKGCITIAIVIGSLTGTTFPLSKAG